jgi:hypothetical protein
MSFFGIYKSVVNLYFLGLYIIHIMSSLPLAINFHMGKHLDFVVFRSVSGPSHP